MQSPYNKSSPSTWGEDAAVCLASIVFAAASAAIYGYSFGQNAHHAFYLPGVLARLDASLYPSDPVVRALGCVPTFFWSGLAALAAVAGLERAAWLLWFFSRGIFAFLTYRTARNLGGERGSAALSLSLTLVSTDLFVQSALAGDPMLKMHLDQTSFTWPLILAPILFWLRGRKTIALISLGLLANLNIMVASAVACWLCLGALLENPSSLREWVPGVGAFLAAASPLLWRVLAHRSTGDISILVTASPQTYLPLQWPVEKWLTAASQVSLGAVLFLKHPRRRMLLSLLASAGVLWAATAFAGLIPMFRWFLSFMFFRLDVAVLWLSLAAAGTVLAPRLAQVKPDYFLAALSAAVVMASPFRAPALTLWAAALLLFENDARGRLLAGLAGAFYGTAALFLPDASLWRLPPLAALTVAIAGGLVGITSVLSPTRPLGRNIRETPAISRGFSHSQTSASTAVPDDVSGAGVTEIIRALSLCLAVLASVFPLAEVAVYQRRAPAAEQELAAVEMWARSLPPETLFIVPPGVSGFRLLSRHPVYAEWTDFYLAAWDAPAARSWQARMSALGVDWAQFKLEHDRGSREWEAALLRHQTAPLPGGLPEWGPKDAGRLQELARRSGARFLVAPSTSHLPWPVVFRAGLTVVHALIPGTHT